MTALPPTSPTQARTRVVTAAISATLAPPMRSRKVPKLAHPLSLTSALDAAVRTMSPMASTVSARCPASEVT